MPIGRQSCPTALPVGIRQKTRHQSLDLPQLSVTRLSGWPGSKRRCGVPGSFVR
jgi:hypothetical protein